MSKWFGEQREWTDNEKTFMVKAAASCRACQAEGQCKWGSSECNECKWQAPMAAIKDLDSFTQARIEDKADMIEAQGRIFESMLERGEAKRKSGNIKLAICMLLLIAIAAVAGYLVNAEPHERSVQRVMEQLKASGPSEWYYDGKADCKDWAVSFMDIWYKQGNSDGTCLLVHNYSKAMNHMMVVANGVVIEPQACSRIDWSPKSYWGDSYDPAYDRTWETWIYLAHADKDTKQLMKRCLVSESEYYANLNGRKMPWEE